MMRRTLLDNEFYLRPSSLSGFWDCQRRFAARQFPEKFRALGYVVGGDKKNAGSSLGTSMHVTFNAILKANSEGKSLTEAEASEIAISDYEQAEAKQEIQYTSAIKDKDKVIKKMVMMTPSLINISKEIDVDQVDVFAERKFPYHDITLTFKGTADVVTKDDLIVDLKTGISKPKTSWLQYCGYYFLFKPKRDIKGLKEFFVSSTKPENNQTKVYGSRDAMPHFTKAFNAILDKTNLFYDKKDVDVFEINPSSMLCSRKYCTIYGTDACPVSKFMELNS